MNEHTDTPKGWRRLPLNLSVMVSDSGLVSISADQPRNLAVTGRSLQEALDAFVAFVEQCAEMGKPFEALHGVKLR
jgi:hypothetical protein